MVKSCKPKHTNADGLYTCINKQSKHKSTVDSNKIWRQERKLLSSNVDLQVFINFIFSPPPLRLNDYKTFENCLECKEILIKADLGENFQFASQHGWVVGRYYKYTVKCFLWDIHIVRPSKVYTVGQEHTISNYTSP